MREIDPTVFGPGTWAVTHALGRVCDQSGRRGDYRFYTRYVFMMVHALPCATCRRHAVRYIDRNPVPGSNKEGSMFDWSVHFHNEVNQRLKKPLMSLEEARRLYENTEVVLKDNSTGSTCSINSEEHGCQDESL